MDRSRAALLPALPVLAALAALARAGEGPTLDQVLARIEARAAEVRDFRARFRQEKSVYLLDKPIVSSGRVLYLRPGRLRWETDAPERSVLAIDEGEMRVYYPKLGQVEVYALPGKEAMGAILPLFGQAAADLRRMYEVSLGRATDEEIALALFPRSERVKRVVSRIEVVLDAKTLLPRRLTYADPNGDEAVTTFEAVEPNVGLAEKDMALEIPPGTAVKKPLGGLPF